MSREYAIFRDEPFFSPDSNVTSEFEKMEQRMANLSSFFDMPLIEASNPFQTARTRSHRNVRQRRAIDSLFSQTSNGPGTHSFSSSKVISYSNAGNGQPTYYEASSETATRPGGIKQTRKSERDSVKGVDRMAVGRHIFDRGHIIERSRNRKTKQVESKEDFLNLEEDDKAIFHQEWEEKTRSFGSGCKESVGIEGYHRDNVDTDIVVENDDGGSRNKIVKIKTDAGEYY